jgi:ankyrin repeat protein
MLALGVLSCGPATAEDVHQMARDGQLDLLKAAVAKAPQLVQAKNPDSETALHEAASYGRTAIVEFLLASGAEVDARDEDGETPLRDAAKYGHTAAMKLLIAKGADVNAVDMDGDTSLHKAVEYGRKAAVELLLASGAATELQNEDGETPRALASIKGHAEIALLLERSTTKQGS